MALDLSRRRFIIGAFASVAGIAAAQSIALAQYLPKPKLEWKEMLAFLEKTMPNHKIEDCTRLAHFVSIKQVKPRVISPPKMLIGWDAMDWQKLTAEGQQESIEFIDRNMLALRRDVDTLAGGEEALIRDDRIGIWAHADG